MDKQSTSNNPELTPTPPEESSQLPALTKHWVKIALLSVLGLVLAGGLVFAGIQIGKKQALPVAVSPASTPTIDPTANWKTYGNEKYKFTFKYPPEWNYAESYSKTSMNNNWLMITLAKKENMQSLPVSGLPNIQVHITESTDQKQFSFYEWTKVVGSTSVDKIQAEIRQHKSSDQKEVVFIKNGYTFEVISQNYNKDTSQNEIFGQILSTFKFLD